MAGWVSGCVFLGKRPKIIRKRKSAAQKVFNKLWKLKFPEINGHFYDLSSPAIPNGKDSSSREMKHEVNPR